MTSPISRDIERHRRGGCYVEAGRGPAVCLTGTVFAAIARKQRSVAEQQPQYNDHWDAITRIPMIENNIKLGLDLLELRAEINDNSRFASRCAGSSMISTPGRLRGACRQLGNTAASLRSSVSCRGTRSSHCPRRPLRQGGGSICNSCHGCTFPHHRGAQ